MKIVFYTDQIFRHGGLERVLTNKLNYLSINTDFKLHVITFQQENNVPCYPVLGNVTFHDLKINYDRELSFLNPSNIKNAPKHFIRLKKKIKEIKPDIVVVCNYEYGYYFIPLVAKSSMKIKEYHSSRYFDFEYRKKNKSFIKKLTYQLSDFFEKKYDYLVLLTIDELQYYKSKKKLVIPNAYTNLTSSSIKTNNKKVIAAGRIAPVKGFEKLILAWEIVNKEFSDWKLEIYGDGELKYIKSIDKLIRNLNLKNSVILKGSTSKLEQKLLNSSIYAMSSETECFPMVLLEAMSCGIPIVSFDCPNGPRNIINNYEDGILVDNNNINELASAIIFLISNPEKRITMGETAKINVQKFSQEKIMKLWIELFENRNKINLK